MQNFAHYLETLTAQACASVGLEMPIGVTLTHPENPKFGDFSTNLVLRLHAQPRAKEIAAKLNELDATNQKILADVTVAGPGFINFSLSEHILYQEVVTVAQPKTLLIQPKNQGKKAVVEYSSPNIAKPFTIGHLRTTVIGDVVANLLEATGYQVFRDNHLGDWGTQFGKQIWAIKNLGSEAEIDVSSEPVKKLVELYVKFHALAEEKPEIEDEGRAWFKKLEDGDPEAKRLWQKCIDWSLKEFQRVYDKLGIKFTENGGKGYGESFFEHKMSPIIKELEEKNLLTDSEGAKLVFFKDDKYPPMMIIKKDGATLYATRDLATDKFRLEKYGKDTLIINEVGAEQALYFKQLFELESLLGWYKEGQRVHVKHGMYRFKDMKMSTRKGNVIWLADVLDEAFKRIAAKQKAGIEEGHQQLTDNEVWKIAIGALKWNDLKREAVKDITFDWDEVLNLQGNSGPYLQYAYVRCQAVLEKAKAQGVNMREVLEEIKDRVEASHPDSDDAFFNAEEKVLAQKLYQLDEVVQKAAAEYAPHHLCTYLFEVAQNFNTFYNQHTILGKEGAEIAPAIVQKRLSLTVATAKVIKTGLEILGIETVERM